MPYRDGSHEDWHEDDLPEGVYEDDEEPTVPCPYCRAELLEDATYCPKCENYLSREDSPRDPRSGFLIATLLLALVAAIIWVFVR